jgi:hypothetical protein
MTDSYGMNMFGTLKPEGIFEKLSLPISYIDDVTLQKSGRSRKFNYKGKELYSPELVALTAFIEDGHSGVWSEGLTIEVLIKAFDKYFHNHLSKYFEITDVSDILIQEAHNRDLVANYYSVASFYSDLNNELQGFNSDDIRLKLNSIEALGLPYGNSLDENCSRIHKFFESNELVVLVEMIERGDSTKAHKHSNNVQEMATRYRDRFKNGSLPLGYLELISSDLQSLQRSIELEYIIKCNVDVSIITREFNSLLESALLDRGLVDECITQPTSDGDKTNPHNKFCNSFTADFARLMLSELNSESIKDVLCKFQYIYPRWDLTILDVNTKKLRFIEVKLNDDFTSYQLRRIPEDLKKGVLIELCIVRPTTVI